MQYTERYIKRLVKKVTGRTPYLSEFFYHGSLLTTDSIAISNPDILYFVQLTVSEYTALASQNQLARLSLVEYDGTSNIVYNRSASDTIKPSIITPPALVRRLWDQSFNATGVFSIFATGYKITLV